MLDSFGDLLLALTALASFISMVLAILVAVCLSSQLTKAERNVEKTLRREVRRVFERTQEPLRLFGSSGVVVDIRSARQRRRT